MPEPESAEQAQANMNPRRPARITFSQGELGVLHTASDNRAYEALTSLESATADDLQLKYSCALTQPSTL